MRPRPFHKDRIFLVVMPKRLVWKTREAPYWMCGLSKGHMGNTKAAITYTAGCHKCAAGRYSDDAGLAVDGNENNGDSSCKGPSGRWSSDLGLISQLAVTLSSWAL